MSDGSNANDADEATRAGANERGTESRARGTPEFRGGGEDARCEALEHELARLRRALEHLERSDEALREAYEESGGTDKDYAEALKENVEAASNIKAKIYEVAVEIERVRGLEKTADEDKGGAWV